MKPPDDVVFLLDVDNTLLDNDRVIDDLRNHLKRGFGPENRNRYLGIFEEWRAELGYADYLGAVLMSARRAIVAINARLLNIQR